jgi:hypothetical protein
MSVFPSNTMNHSRNRRITYLKHETVKPRREILLKPGSNSTTCSLTLHVLKKSEHPDLGRLPKRFLVIASNFGCPHLCSMCTRGRQQVSSLSSYHADYHRGLMITTPEKGLTNRTNLDSEFHFHSTINPNMEASLTKTTCNEKNQVPRRTTYIWQLIATSAKLKQRQGKRYV